MFAFDFETLQWLFPLAITIHNLEEAVWLPGWSKYAGKFHHPVGKVEFRFAVVILTILAWIITYLSSTGGRESIGVYLLCAYCLAMLINIFIPHVAASIVLRRYAPGLVTALMLNLPATSLILLSAGKNGYITWGNFVLPAVVFIAALIGMIPIFFRIGRMFEAMLMHTKS
jgi:hypothetical protein